MTETNLVLNAPPLPSNWTGDPRAFAQWIFGNARILSPFGLIAITVGSVKPANNQGPWLKDGRKWYVWDATAADYVPLDITDSQAGMYQISETTPSSMAPPLWFRIENGTLRNVYFAYGGKWCPITPDKGTTAQRPISPFELQQYYDTDIQTLLWWERAEWRTVAGSPGDVKFVTWPTAAEALRYNPGWEILARNNATWAGRVIGQAAVDPAGTPNASSIPVLEGTTARQAGAVAGEETHKLTTAEMPKHRHNQKGFKVQHEMDSGYPIIGIYGGTETYEGEFAGAGEPHNTIQPTLFLWTLKKN